MHKISQMEKDIASFEYEPSILFLEPKTSNEEENKGNTDGVGLSNTRIKKEEPRDLRGGKDSLQRQASGKTYVVTLALGSRPRQGLAKVWAKREARELHLMLPRV